MDNLVSHATEHAEKLWRHRLSVRTSPFQGGKAGSTPAGAAILVNLALRFRTCAFAGSCFLSGMGGTSDSGISGISDTCDVSGTKICPHRLAVKDA